MSSGEELFTQEPTACSQQGSDELCKSPRTLQDEFHLKWTWAPGTAAQKKPQTHPATAKLNFPFHLYLGKKQWILGFELQTRWILEMSSQRNAVT